MGKYHPYAGLDLAADDLMHKERTDEWTLTEAAQTVGVWKIGVVGI